MLPSTEKGVPMATRQKRRRVRISATGAIKPKGKAPQGPRVRKNMDMDPAKLHAAQAALGAATETETVDRALDLVLGRARFDAALDAITAAGGFRAYDQPR